MKAGRDYYCPPSGSPFACRTVQCEHVPSCRHGDNTSDR